MTSLTSVKVKKIKRVLKTLLIFSVILFSVCLLCGKLFFSKKHFFIFNLSFFIVSSSSMEPEYPKGTLIIAKKVPLKSIGRGDTIIYKSNALNGELAFHRVTRVTEEGVYTKGDVNDFEDNQLIVEETYVAKAILQSYYLGRFLSAIQKPLGFLLFLVLPCLTLYLLFKSIKLFIKNKK